MKQPKKILVIQLRRIGDVILTLPAVNALHNAFPNAQVDFLVEKPADQIIKNSPGISNVVVYNKKQHFKAILNIRAQKYDWVIDYLGNPRSILITALSGAKIKAGINDVFWRFLYNYKLKRKQAGDYIASEKIKQLEPLGVKFAPLQTLPVIKLTPQNIEEGKAELKKLGLLNHKPLIAFAPASRRITRQYPKEHYINLAKMLVNGLKTKVIVFWGPGEKKLAQEICNKAGKGVYLAPDTKTLNELAALLVNCNLLITNCNGPKHIALAVGTKTLTIHGSSDPKVWTPHNNKNHRAIYNKAIGCSPCRSNQCLNSVKCLAQIEHEEVFGVAREMLKGNI